MSVRQFRAGQVLLEVAPQIRSWQLRVKEADLLALVRPNIESIGELELTSAFNSNAYMESDKSALYSLLASLKNLHTLSLHSWMIDLSASSPLFVRTLEDNFAFRHSLRSLHLTFAFGSGVQSNYDYLNFAALLPALAHLRLTYGYHHLEQPFPSAKVSLPKLCFLELEYLHLSAVISLLAILHLTSLLSINIPELDAAYGSSMTPRQQIRHFAQTISSGSPNLSTISLGAFSTPVGVLLEGLRDHLNPSVLLSVTPAEDDDSEDTDSEEDWDSEEEGEIEDAERDGVVEEEQQVREADLPATSVNRRNDKFYARSKTVLSWASEYARSMNGRDSHGGKQLCKLLEPLAKLQRWMKD